MYALETTITRLHEVVGCKVIIHVSSFVLFLLFFLPFFNDSVVRVRLTCLKWTISEIQLLLISGGKKENKGRREIDVSLPSSSDQSGSFGKRTATRPSVCPEPKPRASNMSPKGLVRRHKLHIIRATTGFHGLKRVFLENFHSFASARFFS